MVTNERDVAIVLVSDGCNAPLRIFSGEQRLHWDPDCDVPVCPTEPGVFQCAVCDCDATRIKLEPGTSETFEWRGQDYADLDFDASCADPGGAFCSTCRLAEVVPDGEYVAAVEFESCTDPDGLACDEPVEMEEVSMPVQYPSAPVELRIE